MNNYGFFVERRSKGYEEFEEVRGGFVPGYGTTISRHDYSFVDSVDGELEEYYRLRQVDLDGTIRFSDAVHVFGLMDVPHERPAGFSLFQNFPNPFNPSTTIKYELPNSSEVRLSLYDLLGREVSTLVNERRDAGVHEARFDGSGLSSGVYFYRIEAGSFVQTRKLILLR